MTYAEQIRELAPDLDPRHVEGFMRSEYGTLDHLSADVFKREIKTFRACFTHGEGGLDMAESLAKSYGL